MPTVQVVTDAKEALAALRKLFDWAESLTLVYAWASSGGGSAPHWRREALRKARRAVIGLHFSQTEPLALRELHKFGVLRVMPEAVGVFHPKVIVGLKGDRAQAIVGSSNFTPGGFGANTEVNVVLTGKQKEAVFVDLLKFCDQAWAGAEVPDDAFFERYEQSYADRPRPQRTPTIRKSKRVDGGAVLDVAWPEYVQLVEKEDGRRHPIFDSEESYLSEAEACLGIFRRHPHFAEMTLQERKLVAGWGDDTTKFFGHMGGAGSFKEMTRTSPAALARHLDRVPAVGNPITRRDAEAYLKGVLSVPGVGFAAATRLLCAKRPDAFLPANGASKDELKKMFGRNPMSIEPYLDIIERIWSFAWYKSKRPSDPRERRIWAARVALLDALFYDP